MFENYERVENSNEFEIIPAGNRRVRIASAEKKESKSGNEMIAIRFEVSGTTSSLYYYIVFMNDDQKAIMRTNRNLTRFFDAFSIDTATDDYKKLETWVGHAGGVKVVHEEYNGKMQAKVGYILTPAEIAELPPWEEAGKVKISDGLQEVGVRDEKLPF